MNDRLTTSPQTADADGGRSFQADRCSLPPSLLPWTFEHGGATSEEHAARLFDHGVLVAPGSYLGPSGEGYVRYALVPTEDECMRAAAILEDAL